MGMLPAHLTYTAGRVLSVAARPLSLFMANNWLSPDAAQGLAIAFLASALAMAGIAADPHRRYYASLFSTDRTGNGLSFYLYAASILLLMFVGASAAFGVTAYFTKSAAFAGVVMVYFLSEKLADEILRLRLFERDLHRWGHSAVLRGLLQVGGLAGLVMLHGKDSTSISIALLFTLSNLVVFIPQLPGKFLLSSRRLRGVVIHWLGRRALRLLVTNRMLWFIALMGSGVGYLDRMASLALDHSMLPLFMLVVMCFSMVQMVVDFYYVSPRRRDFLEQAISVTTALRSRQFLASVAGGMGGALVATVLVLCFSVNGRYFPLTYVAAIAVLQSSLAAALLPYQVLYWRRSFVRIFHVELMFWGVLGMGVLAGYWWQLTLSGYLAVVSLVIVLRLLAFVYYAVQADASLTQVVGGKG